MRRLWMREFVLGRYARLSVGPMSLLFGFDLARLGDRGRRWFLYCYAGPLCVTLSNTDLR